MDPLATSTRACARTLAAPGCLGGGRGSRQWASLGHALSAGLAGAPLLVAAAASLAACESEPAEVAGWAEGLRSDTDVGVWMTAWGPPEGGEVWAVGGQPNMGALARFDGAQWTVEVGTVSDRLIAWIHGTDDASFVLAVGVGGTIYRRNGSAWSAMSSPVQTDLWGVFVVASDDAWAVGQAPAPTREGEDPQPTLLRWDGHAWSLVPIPPLDRPCDALFKVWATAPDRVWAVGRGGVILFFDGDQWTQQGSGTSSDLISLWGTGDDHILAVGGRSNAVLARFDGAQWTSQQVPGVAGLNGVWMDAAGAATVDGVFGALFDLEPGAVVPLDVDAPQTSLALHAVFGREDGLRLAVGGSLDSSPPYVGIILQRLP